MYQTSLLIYATALAKIIQVQRRTMIQMVSFLPLLVHTISMSVMNRITLPSLYNKKTDWQNSPAWKTILLPVRGDIRQGKQTGTPQNPKMVKKNLASVATSINIRIKNTKMWVIFGVTSQVTDDEITPENVPTKINASL